VVIAWYGIDANLGMVLLQQRAAADRIAEALEAT